MKGIPCFIQKNHYGYWVISDFDNQDRLVTIKYLYYTKREAIQCFKRELKEINTKNNQQIGATK
jgi:hypothetical protein